MNPLLDELESLLFDWESNQLDSAGIDRVREILKSNEDAREYFVQQQMLNAALITEVASGLGTTVPVTPSSSLNDSDKVHATPKRPFRMGQSMSSVAALLLCLLSGRLLYLELVNPPVSSTITTSTEVSPPNTEEEATSQGVALVTRLVGVKWEQGQEAVEVGEALPPGRFAFAAGYAQLEFFCGATVIIEGPAELDLKSTTLARVHRGRLRTHVPPAARGFSLEVDDMKLVDLGTEFGISVTPEGADVQVFDGEVELLQPTSDKRLLSAGEGVVRTPDGAYRKQEITPDQFVDISTLETHAGDQRNKRFESWKAWSQQLQKDPRLIAYYTFDQPGTWNRRLHSSLSPENSELDGAIVGAKRVAGRWGLKHGLEFKQPGDRVRVQIPGEYGSLTLSCWVKIDSLDRWYNSLFLTDSYNEGEPHWQILETGQLFFSVRPKPVGSNGPSHHVVVSPPFWKPSMSGKWIHFATTFDIESGETTHYLNGEMLHSDTIPAEKRPASTRIGAATLGNWTLPTKPEARFAIRNLNGSIDEFAMFSTALMAEEIKEIYDYGKP